MGDKVKDSSQSYDSNLYATLTTKKTTEYNGWETGIIERCWIMSPVDGLYIGIGFLNSNRFIDTRTTIEMPGLTIYKDSDSEYVREQLVSITCGYLFRFDEYGLDLGLRLDGVNGKIWNPEGIQIYAMFTESVSLGEAAQQNVHNPEADN
jgi:hypothetical protein